MVGAQANYNPPDGCAGSASRASPTQSASGAGAHAAVLRRSAPSFARALAKRWSYHAAGLTAIAARARSDGFSL